MGPEGLELPPIFCPGAHPAATPSTIRTQIIANFTHFCVLEMRVIVLQRKISTFMANKDEL